MVGVGEVNAFVDVDFALVGPVGADHPAVSERDRVSNVSECCGEYGWASREEEGDGGVATYKAGHEPHALPGTCAKSAMTRAWLYAVLLCTLTLFRPTPFGSRRDVESTPMYT